MGHALRDLLKAKEAAARKLDSSSNRTSDKDTSCVPRKKRQRRESPLSRQNDEGYIPSSMLSSPGNVISKNQVGTDVSANPAKVQSSSLVRKKKLMSDGNVACKNSITPVASQSEIKSRCKVSDPYDSDDSSQSGDSEISVDAEMERDYQAALRSMDTPCSAAAKPTIPKMSTSRTISSWAPPCDNEAEKAYQTFLKQMGTSTPPSSPDMQPRRIKGGGISFNAEQSYHTYQEKAYQSLISQKTIATKVNTALALKPTETLCESQSTAPANGTTWNPPGDNEAEKSFQAFMREMNPVLQFSSETADATKTRNPVATPGPLPSSERSMFDGRSEASADEAFQACYRQSQSGAKELATIDIPKGINKDLSFPPTNVAEGINGVTSTREIAMLGIGNDLNPKPRNERCTNRVNPSIPYLGVSEMGTSVSITLLESRQDVCPDLANPVCSNFISAVIPP